MNVPKKVSDRLATETRRFQRVLTTAKDRDINEADTVTIVTDMLADVFGFDKYSEITGEQAIRGTFCDLAVKLGGSVKLLIEVKAVGLELKESHLRQAVNYGANHGVEWVVLTNGVEWDVYRLNFERPITQERVLSLNFLGINTRSKEDQEKLFLLCREGLTKAAIEAFREHMQAVNRFVVGAVLQTEPVVKVVRRALRRITPEVSVSLEEIANIIRAEVMKRDVVEGELASQAETRVRKAASKPPRHRKPSSGTTGIAPALEDSSGVRAERAVRDTTPPDEEPE